jgi:SAM-dependent MidA family methyltransferase
MPTGVTDSTLPAPDEVQRAHSEALVAHLRARIAMQDGWLRFDDYVQLALYAPGLGYYSAGARKFGAAGDFVTAPELSPLFGGVIARQYASARPGDTVLELGAGSGALAATLLTRLAELDALPARYDILEVSADLRARQQERLSALPAELAARVRWLDRLPQAPWEGLVLANEVADALAFRRARWRAGTWQELGVGIDAQGTLQWRERPADAALGAELLRLFGAAPEVPDGYCLELCPAMGPWLAALAAPLVRGALLLFDYGLGRAELYHASRSEGTLRCHYRHRAHDDPFLHPGLQDITAWVDFTRLAEGASDAGLEVAGYCTQAAFLLAGGIDSELGAALAAARSPQETMQRRAEAQRLLMPGEMGETFKALLLTRGSVPAWSAFALQDLRRLL